MNEGKWATFWLIVTVCLMCALWAFLSSIRPAHARDLGQWTTTDQVVSQWFKSLMQPDNPGVSCCGESDAYWADSYEVSKDGEYIAIITDERADEPLRRPHKDIGTKIVVPKHKLKYDQSNPTGHGVIFLSGSDWVYCYLPPGGV